MSPKSSLSLIQTKPSYPGSYSLLWTATSLNYARQKSCFIAVISYLSVSTVALGFPQALGTCCCLSTAMCTRHPRAGRGHLHQHPTQGLSQALDSCCTIRSGWAAARCHHCWFSHLFLSWKYISKKNQGGHSSHIHKQRCVHWQEGNHDICSPSPSNQLTSTFKPCLSFPDHEHPTVFPACCEKQVSHLSLQLVVSRSLI